jgi:subtilisin family serine protease
MSRVAGRILGVDAAHARQLDGAGEIVAICDTGLDRGDPRDPHPYISADRVRVLQVYRRKIGDDLLGHGTHVAGCVIADVANGQTEIRGTAPGAQIVLQSCFRANDSPFGNRPQHVRDVLRDAYDRGARIHSNSWVQIDVGPLYSDTAREIDEFMVSHPDMLVVTATGNEGRFDATRRVQPKTICSPATAKNALAVGGSESEQPTLSQPYDRFFPGKLARQLPAETAADGWANDRKHWAPFSGAGPTFDGRLKPDVVAPCTSILSARSRKRFVGSIWGSSTVADAAVLGGTSIAAPLVAGCCAVVRHALRPRVANPSGALVKAVIINGADQDLEQIPGQPFPAYPNESVGWGRVNVARSLALTGGECWSYDSTRPIERTGDVVRIRVPITGPGELRVTLAWTDPPGERLVSNLDLALRCGAASQLGNGRAPADAENNVEHVRMQVDGSTPRADVTVVATALAGGTQHFALAIAGPVDARNIVVV